VLLLVPVLMPFFFHWYEGVVPPFTGDAVNTAFVPWQIALDGLAAIVTEGVAYGFTDIVIVFEVAGFPIEHVMFPVTTQITWSPFTRELSENVELLVPTFTPFFFHW
jgi:hypothetical protein